MIEAEIASETIEIVSKNQNTAIKRAQTIARTKHEHLGRIRTKLKWIGHDAGIYSVEVGVYKDIDEAIELRNAAQKMALEGGFENAVRLNKAVAAFDKRYGTGEEEAGCGTTSPTS